MKVAIFNTRAGNVCSVDFALRRLGVRPVITSSPKGLREAEGVILPGVGSAGTMMKALNRKGLDRLIPELKQPVLGICLGMQVLGHRSEEGDVKGLGVFPLSSQRFSGGVKVPHMGWNRLENIQGPLFRGVEAGAHVYFVHSYFLPPSVYSTALCRHGRCFSAAVSRDNFFGLQFHPEKSGETGARILENFCRLLAPGRKYDTGKKERP